MRGIVRDYPICAINIFTPTHTSLQNLSSDRIIKEKLANDLHSKMIYECKILKIRPVVNINSLRKGFYKEIYILQDSCHKSDKIIII